MISSNTLSDTNISTNDLPLVSVVLITYNGEKYLEEQLKAIFEQTYPNIEIVAMDDRSKDATVEILNRHAAQRTNMRVVVNEVNLGFIKNFEKGCLTSVGELIALCDQDDYWHKDKIKKMVEAIGNHPMIYCDSHVCNNVLEPTGRKISDIVNCKTWSNCLELAVFCRIYAHATIFKRSFFNLAYPFLDVVPPDWWMPYLATLNGGLKFLPEPLVYYRQHDANVYGVVGGKRKKRSTENKAERNKREKEKIRARINKFYEVCPPDMREEKEVLRKLATSYQNFSIRNNFLRFFTFLQYRNILLSVKKHSPLHRFLFCFKMFAKIK